MANKQTKTDAQYQANVVVVGAGLVGLSAAVALAQQGKQVVVVDAKASQQNNETNNVPTSQYDTRIYAITPSTAQWLKKLGVWLSLEQSRINQIDNMLLWHPDAMRPLTLGATDARLPNLGYIVESAQLMQALWDKVNTLEVNVLLGHPCHNISLDDDKVLIALANGDCISADLILGADGVHSFVRQQFDIAKRDKDFEQIAIVANFTIEQHHQHAARQWFAPHETLALLPLPDHQVSMVWSVSTSKAAELLLLSGEALTEQVQTAAYDANVGCLRLASNVQSFPLKQVTAVEMVGHRVVLVGDAAHQVHPMAGQGANLGFRDIMALENHLGQAHPLVDIGEVSFLRTYERNRKADILSMNTLTSGLDSLFANQSSMVRKATALGMGVLDNQTFLKQMLIQQAVA